MEYAFQGQGHLEDLNLHVRRGTEQQRLRAHRRRGGKPSLRVGAKVNLGTTGIHELSYRDPVASRDSPEPATEGLARQGLGNCGPSFRPFDRAATSTRCSLSTFTCSHLQMSEPDPL